MPAYILTGAPPFPAHHQAQQLFSIIFNEPKSIREINSLVSAELEAICFKALRKDPKDRYTSADEFAQALWAVKS